MNSRLIGIVIAGLMSVASVASAHERHPHFSDAMKKCLEGKGIQLPKPDPARKEAFAACKKEGGDLKQCLASKGIKRPERTEAQREAFQNAVKECKAEVKEN